MSHEQAEEINAIHTLIDDIILCIGRLEVSPGDSKLAGFFCKKLETLGQFLDAHDQPDLAAFVSDISNAFNDTSPLNRPKTTGILKIALSFLGLARKAIMFSEDHDLMRISSEMLLILKNSLQHPGWNAPAD